MNAKKIRKNLISAVLCAAMLTAPAGVVAAETSAHVPNSVEAQPKQERMPSLRDAKAYRGVSVSTSWLRQVRLGGMLINLRLHTPMGDEVVFREMLKAAPSDVDSMCLYLMAGTDEAAITMQLDQSAVDALNNLGIVEIVVADENRNVRAHYNVAELEAVRHALGLTPTEQLCVTGEDAPVTVVSEDGVRRQINP